MQSKQVRALTLMTALLLALVAVLVLVDPPSEDGEAVPLFPDLTLDEVRAVEVKRSRDGVNMRFTREDLADDEEGPAPWRMVEPVEGPADRHRVDELISRLVEIEAGDALAEGDGAVFGLAEPRLEITLSTNDSPVTLHVGDDSPVGYSTYVRAVPDGPVRAAGSHLTGPFNDPVDDYRRRDLLELDVDDVRSVAWSFSGGDGRLTHDGERWWYGELRADPDRVRSFLQKLGGMRISEFDAPPEEASGGRLEILGQGLEWEIDLGRHTEAGLAARVPWEDAPVMLHEDLPHLLKEPALLPSALLPFQSWAVTSISVKLGDREFSASRTGLEWSHPEAEGLLAALREATVDRSQVASASMDDEGDEGDEEWGVVDLELGQERSERLVLGPPRPDRSHLAADQAGGPPFLVTAEVVETLGEALPDPHQEPEPHQEQASTSG